MKKLKFLISTPTGHKYENNEVRMVTADIFEGRIGVMPEHIPLISSLKVSYFKITDLHNNLYVGVVKGGIFNVTREEVTIFTTNFCMYNEVKINHVNDEIKNIKYQLSTDSKPAELESLNNRLKYSNLKRNLFYEKSIK